MNQINKPVPKKRTADEYGAIMDDVLEDGSDSEDEQEPAIKRQAVAQMPHAMDPSSIVHQSVNNDGKKQKSQKRQKGEPKGKLTAYGFFSKEIRTFLLITFLPLFLSIMIDYLLLYLLPSLYGRSY